MRRTKGKTANGPRLVVLGMAVAASLAAACSGAPTGPTMAAPVGTALTTAVTG